MDKRLSAQGVRLVRTASFEDVEAVMYEWFVDVRPRNVPVPGPMIKQKAKDLAFLLGRKESRGGSGWIQQSKERYETASVMPVSIFPVATENSPDQCNEATFGFDKVWSELSAFLEAADGSMVVKFLSANIGAVTKRA